MRARLRSARARTEENNRQPHPPITVRGLRPRTFTAKRRTQSPRESEAFARGYVSFARLRFGSYTG
jgi:hypothetical protein